MGSPTKGTPLHTNTHTHIERSRHLYGPPQVYVRASNHWSIYCTYCTLLLYTCDRIHSTWSRRGVNVARVASGSLLYRNHSNDGIVLVYFDERSDYYQKLSAKYNFENATYAKMKIIIYWKLWGWFKYNLLSSWNLNQLWFCKQLSICNTSVCDFKGILFFSVSDIY